MLNKSIELVFLLTGKFVHPFIHLNIVLTNVFRCNVGRLWLLLNPNPESVTWFSYIQGECRNRQTNGNRYQVEPGEGTNESGEFLSSLPSKTKCFYYLVEDVVLI